MTFNSLTEVYEGFFKQFLGVNLESKIFIVKTEGQTDRNVRVQFARESSEDYSEASDESYPVVSIASFLPVKADIFSADGSQYAQSIYDPPIPGLRDTVVKIPPPRCLEFSFEVNVFARKWLRDYVPINEYILSRFSRRGSIPLISEVLPNGELFEKMAYYMMNHQENPREDGVYETQYNFTLRAFVALEKPQEYAPQNVIIYAGPNGIEPVVISQGY